MNSKMNDLATLTPVADGIFDIQLQKGKLTIEVQELEKALRESEAYKLLEQKKAELAEYEVKEEHIKQVILDGMINNDLKSVEFTYQKFTVKSNPPSVRIIDEELIPKEYKNEKVTITVDKKKIKDAIQNGGIVDGAELTCWHTLLITPK